MHHARAAIALFLLASHLAVPLAANAQSPPVPLLFIAELEADPDTTLGEREFVEIWNAGNTTVALLGWKLRDAPTTSGSTNTYTFPAWSLPPGARVVVWGGGAGDSRGPAWSNPSVWNNAGDAASLLDSSGTIVDWLGYGSTAAPPPTMANKTIQAKPGQGQSLQLDRSSWILAAPTPGVAIGATGGGLTVEVANVAPTAGFGDLPRWVRPGSQPTIPLVVDDPNGQADVASWSLRSGATVLASGLAGGNLNVTVPAPRSGATWDIELQVTDQGGLLSTGRATLPLRFSDLLVVMPGNGPLPFPSGGPGSDELVAAQAVTIRNLGDVPLVPHLDVSAFSGPATFPAEGHLSVGWTDASGTMQWLPYAGPFTALPELGPGAELAFTFRLRNLPTPLPAGAYGTSFTVVP